MLQIIFALLLLSIIILPIPLLMIADRRQKRKALKSLLHEFSNAGSNNGLSFSSQEVLQNTVIGIDGSQRKLLVVKQQSDSLYQSLVIDLNEVKDCGVDKQYRTISRGDSAKPEKILESISLVFNVPQLNVPEVVFYNHTTDPMHTAPEMESKAKQWQLMFAKLQTPLLKTA